jgi:hypothetical protein
MLLYKNHNESFTHKIDYDIVFTNTKLNICIFEDRILGEMK